MLEINRVPVPKCRFKDCEEIAEYELTDVVLGDKEKYYEDRTLKTVTVSYACDKHLEEIRLKYAE